MAYNKPKRGDLEAIWEISCKSFKLSHDVGFFCHKTTKVNVFKVLYHSMALTTVKLGIYSYPHDLAVLSRMSLRPLNPTMGETPI